MRSLVSLVRAILRRIYRIIPGKVFAFSCIRYLWTPPEWLYRHLHFTGTLDISVRGRTVRLRHYGYMPENMLFWGGVEGGYEPRTLGLWLDLASEAQCILDVGANTGIFALLARAVNADALIFAFEPAPGPYAKLCANVRLNEDTIRCLNLAVSDYDGHGELYEPDREHALASSMNREFLADVESAPGGALRRTPVACARLDTFLASSGVNRVDLLKIDVETLEAHVLRGLGSRLRTDRPTMIIEVVENRIGCELEAILGPLEYEYFYIDEAAGLVPSDRLRARSDRNYMVRPAGTATTKARCAGSG